MASDVGRVAAQKRLPSSHLRSNAFTLVELFVVIGIIAVLIGVLLPALGRARKQANTIKCATQLREIGNAFRLYATEYRGYWPVIRHEADTTFPPAPDLDLRSAVARNDYWYQFLLKYFTKREYQNTSGLRLLDFQNTPLWGCPAVDKGDFDASSSSAEFNSGYGMNFSPGLTPFTPKNTGANSKIVVLIQKSPQYVGKYWKMTQWTRSSERCLVADSRAWFLEATYLNNPLDPAGDEPIGVGYLGSYNNQFNRYRHGDRKQRKQGFNVLFCDGHVTMLTDVIEGIKSIRFRYPN